MYRVKAFKYRNEYLLDSRYTNLSIQGHNILNHLIGLLQLD